MMEMPWLNFIRGLMGYGQGRGEIGPVKLIQRVKIAHSFLQPELNLFHFIILSLTSIQFHIWLSKNFLKPTSKNGEIGHFDLESHFSPTLKISCCVLLNSYSNL